MNKKELVNQTKLAFDFIQKLYIETSYLIKEIEGLLAEEEERFVIGRPSGYQITSRSSAGLEANYVNLWLLRKLSTFFVSEEFTKRVGGATKTDFKEKLKIIYLRIVFNETERSEPYIIAGVFYNFFDKKKKWPTKFEQLISHLEYYENKVYDAGETFSYKDNYSDFKGINFRVNLFDINSSEEIIKLIITPLLILYREISF